MRNFSEENLTQAVLDKLESCKDERFKTIMASLIRHVHEFVRETELSEAEWMAGIDFLTRTGQKCDDKRQEFILLSDTLGVSMLVDAINHRSASGATESTVLGPFFREGAPEFPNGANLVAEGTGGEPCAVSGRVLDLAGHPIAGALLDVWEGGPDGLYDMQKRDGPEFNLRGRFRTDAQGRFDFRTVKPTSYPVPTDGPVGGMLLKLGWHPMRPAHIHFVISAPGYETLTTHLFSEGDSYLDSDAVFGVKGSLVKQFQRHESLEEAARLGLTAPFWSVSHDFVLKQAASVK